MNRLYFRGNEDGYVIRFEPYPLISFFAMLLTNASLDPAVLSPKGNVQLEKFCKIFSPSNQAPQMSKT